MLFMWNQKQGFNIIPAGLRLCRRGKADICLKQPIVRKSELIMGSMKIVKFVMQQFILSPIHRVTSYQWITC